MAGEAERVDGYLSTVARLEPDISAVDREAALVSIAISLKRIADALQGAGIAAAIEAGMKQGSDHAAEIAYQFLRNTRG